MSRRESVSGPGMEEEDAFRLSMTRLRAERGWTQADLANAMTQSGWTGIYQTTISRMEKGERPIRIGEARGIARVFGVTVGLMIAPSEERKPVEELRRTVDRHREVFFQIGDAAQEFTFLKSAIGPELMAVEGVRYEDWADSDMRSVIEGIIARAKQQMDWTIQGAVDFGHSDYGDPDNYGLDPEDSE